MTKTMLTMTISLLVASHCYGQSTLVGTWTCTTTNQSDPITNRWYSNVSIYQFKTNATISITTFGPSGTPIEERRNDTYESEQNCLRITYYLGPKCRPGPVYSEVFYLFGIDKNVLFLTNMVTGDVTVLSRNSDRR